MFEDEGCMPLTAVAIDRDKNSQQAVKWAVDHLVANNPSIVLIHIRIATPQGCNNGAKEGGNVHGRSHSGNEVAEMFRSYRLYCARKAMKVKEVILDDIDVSKALIEYTNNNHIMNIVVGASNRNALTRKFRNPDVPSTLLKAAPDFCTVYVIWKGKAFSVRTPKNQASNTTGKPMIPPSPRYPTLNHMEQDEPLSSRAARGGWRVPLPITPTPDRRSIDRNAEYMKTPSRDRPLSTARTVPPKLQAENLETPVHLPRSTDSMGSFSEDFDLQRLNSFGSSDFSDSHEFSSFPAESPRSSISPSTTDTADEMKRLKLELKQTMDMYSNACKEAISAKQKAKELHQWKMEEAGRVEEARQAEEAALAIAEMEKARCKAAIEAAQAAQRTAELETKMRLTFEFAAKREAEEKKRALDALNQNDVRYRKYSIEEIEVATDNFAKALKIGEGGYGPVYRATLEHTAVAIKVLRPDAAQGRKQFQQEVEVLCCIRHPHMVLLLGACPEYGCLVYEYMDNGSLEDRLFRRGNTPPMPWSTRFKIAAEIAAGLLFLHQAKPEPLVHRDLKPANILLDRNYVSKIADVGLARLVPPSVADTVTQYRMTSTAGTFCYIDPEYQQTGMLGTKSDMYSLGIMLLQIITAKPPMGLTHHVKTAIDRGTFKEMLDPTIKDWPMEETLSFAKLALKCSELTRKNRPDLGAEILPELNRFRHIGDEWESSSVGGSSSLFGSTPISHSNAHPWWSQVHQERLLSNPQMGVPWSRPDAFEASKSSAAI